MNNRTQRETIAIRSATPIYGYVYIPSADNHAFDRLEKIYPLEETNTNLEYNGGEVRVNGIYTSFTRLYRTAASDDFYFAFVSIPSGSTNYVVTTHEDIVYAPSATIKTKTFFSKDVLKDMSELKFIIDAYTFKNSDFYEAVAATFWNTEATKEIKAKKPLVYIHGDRIEINDGIDNQGNGNCGDDNIGSYNIGNNNHGNLNLGLENEGDANFGMRNTGNYNCGNYNVGFCNKGNSNYGMFNCGDSLRGLFNTNDAHDNYSDRAVYAFNKPIKNTVGEYIAPKEIPELFKSLKGVQILQKWITDAYILNLVNYAVMPATKAYREEVEENRCVLFDKVRLRNKQYPDTSEPYSYFNCDWQRNYIAARLERATEEEMDAIVSLPNFDAEIFCSFFKLLDSMTFPYARQK